MATMDTSNSAAVRARLTHPVIDSDGHMIEFKPGFLDALKHVGGRTMLERFRSEERNTGSLGWGRENAVHTSYPSLRTALVEKTTHRMLCL
jgi:hypothetical protein